MSRIGNLLSCAVVLAASLAATSLAEAGHYSTAVLLDNPVAYYRLNESTGTSAANLGSGTGINGNYVNIPGGGVTGNNSLYGEAGPRSTAFNGFEADNNSVFFDPSTDNATTSTSFPRVEVPVANTSNPLVITGALTLEAWIKRSAVTPNNNNQGIVGRFVGGGDNRSYLLYFDPATEGSNGGFANANPGFGFVSSTNGVSQSLNAYEFGVAAGDVDAMAAGKWVHVAAVFEPGVRVEMYVNGASIGVVTSGVAGALSDKLAPLWIGQQFSAARQWTFDGNIDEVAIYAAALSDDQIKNHYDAAFIPEPVSWQLALLAGAALWYRRRKAA